MSHVRGILHCLEVKRLITSPRVGKWCVLPYHGHPRGCPYYGKRPTCPPDSRPIAELLDVTRPVYLVYSFFDLRAHVERMKTRHPKWTDVQCQNVRYWQGTARAGLRRNVTAAMGPLRCDVSTFCPEGAGVNVFATARAAGLRLERTGSIKIDRHVALIGHSPGGGK